MCRAFAWRAWRWIAGFKDREWADNFLLAAGRRCLLASAEVGGVVLVIDAKNESSALHHAQRLSTCPPLRLREVQAPEGTNAG
jgi:hypothetical protein